MPYHKDCEELQSKTDGSHMFECPCLFLDTAGSWEIPVKFSFSLCQRTRNYLFILYGIDHLTISGGVSINGQGYHNRN
jgi:hypothetical protein